MEQFDFTGSPLHQDDRGAIRVIGSRITLDTLMAAYQRGDAVEEIHDGFPSLSLAQIKSVIAWYLTHTSEADEYLAKGDAEEEELIKRLQSDPRHKERRELLKQRWEQLTKQRQEQLVKH
ncbi:MAG TPA: DUF433 domain-containing protein [Pyrinomonadaceae bacterium]|nr:DUF433 domain-containing protein [Pyrinomonadaceae bacterium]